MALSESRRILKDEGKMTLVFHSATAEIWNALQNAYQEAGLSVECAGVLDKTQGSFKQVTTAGAVRGDPVLLLGKQTARKNRVVEDVWHVAEQIRMRAVAAPDPVEQTVQRLYSRLITFYLANNQPVPVDADAFYDWHAGLSIEGAFDGVQG